MKFSKSSSLAGAALLSVASAQDNSTSCKSGVHIIVARASFEPAGFGILKAVADNVTAQVPDSDSVAVPYPATFVDPGYVISEQEGVGNMTQLVKEYGDACPDGRMALMGYSQGAQVVGDTVAGTDADAFSDDVTTTGLDDKYLQNIAAIIIMGDPSFVKGQSFNVGNSTKDGVFPRENTQKFFDLGLAGKMQSYCDSNDTYCDSGKSSLVHASYVMVYGEDAVKFVVEKVNAAGSGNSTSNGTTTGTSTMTMSSSSSSSSSAPAQTESGSDTAAGTASGSGSAAATPSNTNDAPAGQTMSYWMTGVLGSALVLALWL